MSKTNKKELVFGFLTEINVQIISLSLVGFDHICLQTVFERRK